MIAADGLFTDRLDQIVALTQRYSVPTMLAASTAAITREPAPQKRTDPQKKRPPPARKVAKTVAGRQLTVTCAGLRTHTPCLWRRRG
jgi:hypothetical protein